MDVTLIRHGTARDRAATDADRELTSVGREEARRTGLRLAQVTPLPDAIISSPYRRALETARIIAEAVGFGAAVITDPTLVPDAPPEGVRELIATLGDRRHVVLVAHEPLLSATSALLLGTPFPGLRRAEMVGIRKSTDAAFPNGHFTLRFRS